MRKQLINYYLDWFNNYATVALFAEHNGLTENQAMRLIELGKELHETPHPES